VRIRGRVHARERLSAVLEHGHDAVEGERQESRYAERRGALLPQPEPDEIAAADLQETGEQEEQHRAHATGVQDQGLPVEEAISSFGSRLDRTMCRQYGQHVTGDAVIMTAATRLSRVARAVARRVLAFVLAALVIITVLASGKTYLWCASMQRAMDACCCAGDATARLVPADEGATLQPPCCCESREARAVSKAQAPAPPVPVPPAVMTAVLAVIPAAPARPVTAFAPKALPRIGRYCSTRAGPRSASDTCIQLQVFRC
jgi:hypothetical protein